MALTLIEQVRLNVADSEPGFYFLQNEEISHLLEKNNQNVGMASIDAARVILFKLSMQNTETVSIFTIKNTSAESYRQALLLYIKDPLLNPMYRNLKGWVGGVSKSEMKMNDDNPDNNTIQFPNKDRPSVTGNPPGFTWNAWG